MYLDNTFVSKHPLVYSVVIPLNSLPTKYSQACLLIIVNAS